ncbi:MAG: SDR family oxidoreductase [Parvularculaceae bacterium]|nr:SDR family oxidoreductase [Parvularculaceae bacterium]
MTRVLVLGGYGFIGAELLRALHLAGFKVRALGRDGRLGRRLSPEAEWIGADISKLTQKESWRDYLSNVDIVVNASGALQTGARDDLSRLQDVAIRACIAAAQDYGVSRFIQISAPGANEGASTEFMTTKANADAALRASALEWVVFKPGLVIGANAYGGTALMRMLAGFPFVEVLVHANAPVQTVAISDVADAVVRVAKGEAPMRADYDLVEERPRTLRESVRAMRAWMGLPPAKVKLSLPGWVGAIVGAGADIAGNLGWRSPLRTTALRVMGEGVTADPSAWKEVTGAPLKSLDETLADIPATAQERIFAKVQLMTPVIVASLAGFWAASGVVGLMRAVPATELLTPHMPFALAIMIVVAGSLIDIAIGAALLLRRTSRKAAVASAAVASFYIFAATHFAPELWFDPLGVYMKVLPCIILSLVLAALLEER